MSHTPAPWRASCGKAYTLVTRDSQGKNDRAGSVLICRIAGPEDSELRPFNADRWEADARLIAAAPDLLEALIEERRIRLLGQQPDVHWESLRDARRDCYAKTDAAIAKAKAKGETE